MTDRARRGLALLIALAVLVPAGLPHRLQAQDATSDTGTADAVITLVAGDVPNPRGFTWNGEGTLFVGSAGIGGTQKTPNDRSGSVVRIDDGCPVNFAGDFPSSSDMGSRIGISDVAILNDTLYALVDGVRDVQADTPAPNGVYRINPDGSWEVLANIGAWIEANPVANYPEDADAGGEPYAMISDGEGLWISESNSGQILRVTADGAITRVADLSADHPFPTGIALAPAGGVYVGYLTARPYIDGGSKVSKVAPDGTVTDVWTGLTMLASVGVAADGTLYALEMSTGNPMTDPFYRHDAGRVVRHTGPSSLEEVATGLDLPIAMAFGPDGGLYVALPALSEEAKPGSIVRIETAATLPLAMTADVLTADCAVESMPSAAPIASPAASPAA